MTRTEAIINLALIRTAFVDHDLTKEQNELVNTTFQCAIEALQEVPQFVVHADGTIEQINEAVQNWKPQVECMTNIGHWMPVKGYEGILYECSQCHDKRHHTTIKWNYCPCCGAKMEDII